MIKYVFIITGVCAYDTLKIINKGKKVELFILLFFAALSLLLCTMHVSDPVNASLSEPLLTLFKSKYLEGN